MNRFGSQAYSCMATSPCFLFLPSFFFFVCSSVEPWLFWVQLGVQEFEWPQYLGRGNTLRSPMSSSLPADTRATTALSVSPSQLQRHRLHTSWLYCCTVSLQKFSFVVYSVDHMAFVTAARVTLEITVVWRGKMSHWLTLSCFNPLCCVLSDLQRLEPIRFVVSLGGAAVRITAHPVLVPRRSCRSRLSGPLTVLPDNNTRCRVLSFSIHFARSRISNTCCHKFSFLRPVLIIIRWQNRPDVTCCWCCFTGMCGLHQQCGKFVEEFKKFGATFPKQASTN